MIISEVLLSAWPPLLTGAITTIQITLGALIIGVTGGLIIGALTARKMDTTYTVKTAINTYVLIIRGTPAYVQVLIFYYALPDLLNINLSPIAAGILAIGCNAIAYIGEIIRGGINAIPDGQWHAGYVLGYRKHQTFKDIILPQVIKNSIPALTNECCALIKETSILAAIGVSEITRVAMNINAKELQPVPVYLSIALLYLALTTAVTIISKKIEKRTTHDNG